MLREAWLWEKMAAEKWGREAQAFMVCEEAGELTTAICQFGRGRIPSSKLLDEAADGVIVSAAAAFLAGATADELEQAVAMKLARLARRIQADEPVGIVDGGA